MSANRPPSRTMSRRRLGVAAISNTKHGNDFTRSEDLACPLSEMDERSPAFGRKQGDDGSDMLLCQSCTACPCHRRRVGDESIQQALPKLQQQQEDLFSEIQSDDFCPSAIVENKKDRGGRPIVNDDGKTESPAGPYRSLFTVIIMLLYADDIMTASSMTCTARSETATASSQVEDEEEKEKELMERFTGRAKPGASTRARNRRLRRGEKRSKKKNDKREMFSGTGSGFRRDKMSYPKELIITNNTHNSTCNRNPQEHSPSTTTKRNATSSPLALSESDDDDKLVETYCCPVTCRQHHGHFYDADKFSCSCQSDLTTDEDASSDYFDEANDGIVHQEKRSSSRSTNDKEDVASHSMLATPPEEEQLIEDDSSNGDDQDEPSLTDDVSHTSTESSSTASSDDESSLSSILSRSSSEESMLSYATEGSCLLSLNNDKKCSSSSSSSTSCCSAKLMEQVEKIVEKFQHRDKIFEHIVNKGMSRSYVEFLKQSEVAVRYETFKKLSMKKEAVDCLLLEKDSPFHSFLSTESTENNEKTDDKKAVSSSIKRERQGSDQEKTSMTSSTAEAIRRRLLFECYHALPAVLTMLLYCVAHITVFEFMLSIFQHMTEALRGQAVIYVGLLMAGVLITRISGGVWIWLNDDMFECVKFDMHNRLRLNDTEAHILRWIKKRPLVQVFIDVTSLYACFIAVHYLLCDLLLPSMFDKRNALLAGLPSLQHKGLTTHIRNVLEKGDDYFEDDDAADWGGDDITLDDCIGLKDALASWDCYEALRMKLNAQDGLYIEDMVSAESWFKIMGDPLGGVYGEWSEVLFFGTISIISVFLLSKLGVGFWSR